MKRKEEGGYGQRGENSNSQKSHCCWGGLQKLLMSKHLVKLIYGSSLGQPASNMQVKNQVTLSRHQDSSYRSTLLCLFWVSTEQRNFWIKMSTARHGDCVKLVFVNFIQTRDPEEWTLIKELPPLDWSVGNFLDSWLIYGKGVGVDLWVLPPLGRWSWVV